jgi:hypothetical protein
MFRFGRMARHGDYLLIAAFLGFSRKVIKPPVQTGEPLKCEDLVRFVWAGKVKLADE